VLRESGERVPRYLFDVDCERGFDFLAIDEESLARSEIALRKMIREGKRSMLGAQIHSSSLLKQTDRNRLFKVMDRFSQV
jgi:hypothetical protein